MTGMSRLFFFLSPPPYMHIPGGIIKVTQTWRRKTFKNTVQVFHHEKVGERDEKTKKNMAAQEKETC